MDEAIWGSSTALTIPSSTAPSPLRPSFFRSSISQVLYKNPRPAAEIASDIPSSLDGVIARALTKTPEERYASGDELANDLLAVRQGTTPPRALSLGERTR